MAITQTVVDAAPPTILERLLAYTDPSLFILVAVKQFILTILYILFVERSPAKLLNLQAVRDRAFSNFWQSVGMLNVTAPPLPRLSHSRTTAPPAPISPKDGSPLPALEGSLALLNPHLQEISGVVLDVGPGTGHTTGWYPAHQISAIYGAEPNEGLHEILRRNADDAGMGAKYTILSCGAERQSLVPALKKAELLPRSGPKSRAGEVEGVFDTIICARVLCCVEDLEQNLEVLYGLLKPGGKFVIVEHVINPAGKPGRGDRVGRLMQVVYKPFWEYFIRCRLDADPETVLMDIGKRHGGWHSVRTFRKQEWTPLAWWSAVLVKTKRGSRQPFQVET